MANNKPKFRQIDKISLANSFLPRDATQSAVIP